MSLSDWLKVHWLTEHKTTPQEIADLLVSKAEWTLEAARRTVQHGGHPMSVIRVPDRR